MFNTRNPPLEHYEKVVQDTANEARERVLTCLGKKGFHKIPVFIVSAWRYRDFMMERERLDTLADQQTTPPHFEACKSEPLSQQISHQGVDNDILADDEIRQQEIIEHDSLAKMALLAFELTCLLDYIAGVALYRRL